MLSAKAARMIVTKRNTGESTIEDSIILSSKLGKYQAVMLLTREHIKELRELGYRVEFKEHPDYELKVYDCDVYW